MRDWFHTDYRRDCGNFGTASDELLTLFVVKEPCDSRHWRKVFGFEHNNRCKS